MKLNNYLKEEVKNQEEGKIFNLIKDMKKGEKQQIKNIGYNANKVINAVIVLQKHHGQEYKVGELNGQIGVWRIK